MCHIVCIVPSITRWKALMYIVSLSCTDMTFVIAITISFHKIVCCPGGKKKTVLLIQLSLLLEGMQQNLQKRQEKKRSYKVSLHYDVIVLNFEELVCSFSLRWYTGKVLNYFCVIINVVVLYQSIIIPSQLLYMQMSLFQFFAFVNLIFTVRILYSSHRTCTSFVVILDVTAGRSCV